MGDVVLVRFCVSTRQGPRMPAILERETEGRLAAFGEVKPQQGNLEKIADTTTHHQQVGVRTSIFRPT
jgi:hypothetical protein